MTAPDAMAQATWTGASDADWANGTNWNTNPVVPGAGDTAIINNGALANQPLISTNQTVDQTNISAGSLTIGADLTSPVTLSGTGNLTINAGGRVVGAVAMGSGGTLANNGTITGNLAVSNGTVNNAGVVTGTTTLTGGQLILNAGANLADAQRLTVNAGTLNVNASETVGSLAGTGGTIVIAAGRTLTAGGDNTQSSFSGTMSGAGSIAKSGASDLTLSGNNLYSGTTTINSGTLNANSSAALGNGSVTNTLIFDGASTLRAIGTIASPATRGVTLNAAATIDNNGNVISISGAITGAGSLTKVGGGTLTLSGNNTYTGGTTVSTSTLALAGGAAIADTGAVNVGANGILDVTAAETIGSLAGTPGAQVALGATLTTGGNNASTTFEGVASGAGGLTKIGTGTMTLTGGNTYGGVTTISAGALNIQNAAGLGSTAAGTVVAAGSELQLQGGILIGAEALTLNGTGVALGGALRNVSGANTYSGAITLGSTSRINADAGRLSLTGGLVAGGNNLSFGVAPGATIAVEGGNATGIGALTKDGVGTLEVANGQTLSAATINNTAGTFTNAGTVSGATTNNAGATFNTTGIFNGALTNSGTVNAAGQMNGSIANNAGTITLTGTTSGIAAVTQAAGATFNLAGFATTFGSLSGGGDLQLGSAVLTTGGNNTSTAFAGVISGTGGLTKAGTGTMTLTGTSTYTGTTQVSAGTLLVNGSIATSSGLNITSGATIGGSGTLPATIIANGGTLSPGNSIGTLAVNGNLTLGGTSTTVIEVQGTTIDRINVTGTAALAGTVRFVPLGGSYSFNTPYTFLQAATITGTFGTQTVQGSFGDGVTTAVSYTATEARLTLTPAPLLPVITAQPTQQLVAPQAGTPNQVRVATAIDRAVAGGANASPFFNLYNQSRSGILSGLDQLSGVVHTGAPTLGHHAANGLLGAIFNPMAGRETPTPGLLVSAYIASQEAAWASGELAIARTTRVPLAQSRTLALAPIYGVWASVTGGTERLNGETLQGSPRLSTGFGGVAVGVDVRVAPETVVGVAMGGAAGSASSGNSLGTVDTNLFQLGLYGSTRLGGLSLAAAGAWSIGEAQSTRAIPILGVANASSRYGIQGLSGRFEAAWTLGGIGNISVSPFAAIQASSFRNAAFVERNDLTGGAVGFAGTATTNITARTELGLKLEIAGQIGSMPTMAFMRAGWGHAFSRDADSTGQIVGLPGSTFSVTGTRTERDVALLAAGATLNVTSAIAIGGRVDAELGSRTQAVRGSVSIRWAF